jgi:hypothetical protein
MIAVVLMKLRRRRRDRCGDVVREIPPGSEPTLVT